MIAPGDGEDVKVLWGSAENVLVRKHDKPEL
jgi:hypothetical protein